MNGIDCSPTDPNHCCAVAEGSSSSEPGARIFCTTDGKTWYVIVRTVPHASTPPARLRVVANQQLCVASIAGFASTCVATTPF